MTCVLVLSTVHQADDPRLLLRTVGVLAQRFAVRYATRGPAPSTAAGSSWVELPGGRLRRHLAAARQAWRRDVGLVSLHDAELVPLGLAVRWVRRIPVVFDLHEDVPAQLRTKPWLPAWLRPPLAALAAVLLRLAERWLAITLAEPGYARLFRRSHPVLPNYPLSDQLPPSSGSGPPAASGTARGDSLAASSDAVGHTSGDIVYVGDVTEARGASFAVQVVARVQPPHRLRLIGRCAPALRARLQRQAAELGVELDLPGFLPHAEAMRAVAPAAVGLCPLEDQPNYRYSLPTKVLEYLALGVPVVASDLPGTAELAAGRPGVQLVAPRDVDEWAQAVARAAQDPRVRAAARAAADQVRAQFTWPAQRLLDTYARLQEQLRDTSADALVG